MRVSNRLPILIGREMMWGEFAGDAARCQQVAEAIIASLHDPEVVQAWIEPDIEESIQEAEEGRLLTRKHLARERNRQLVESKRKQAMKKFGKLRPHLCPWRNITNCFDCSLRRCGSANGAL